MRTTGLHKQQGLSLIELMISITLGLVLLGAAIQVMITNGRTFRINDDVSRVQENGRIALDILTKDLRLAGYRQPFNGDGTIPDFFNWQCAGIENCADDGSGRNASDRIAVQFDPPPDDGTETDCLGQAVNATSVIINVYTVEDRDGDNVNSLYCRGYDVTNDNWINNTPAQPLIDGIDSMQVLYGVAGTPGSETSVTRYVPFNVLTPADYPNIRSVKVGLLVSNGQLNGTADVLNRVYTIFDSVQLPFLDGHLRRIYSTTVNFNNTTL